MLESGKRQHLHSFTIENHLATKQRCLSYDHFHLDSSSSNIWMALAIQHNEIYAPDKPLFDVPHLEVPYVIEDRRLQSITCSMLAVACP